MVEPVVKRETLRITAGTLILSAVMQFVFIIIKCWDMTVLFGNLLGAFAAVLNFFLMCMTVQRCVSLEPDKAAYKIRISQSGRLVMMAAFLGIAALIPKVFNIFAAAIPLIFPTLTIAAYRFFLAKKDIAEREKSGIKPQYKAFVDEEDEEQD
ncbi:MAG: ATP synthase subunit I [Clostridia bacterium]|nr:ATP synthase subunit I [Clostridia bacterium]